MEHSAIVSYVLGLAAKSNVEKRQVGCVILDETGVIVAEGYNLSVEGEPDIHAEAMACEELAAKGLHGAVAYVSHPPCPNCAKILNLHGINEIHVVEAFMKFDSDKIRYDLVEPEFLKGIAEALTFGAKKYKPNNWKNCEDPNRYYAAAMRHLEAVRLGEFTDNETGLSHVILAATNMMFYHHFMAKRK